MNLKRCCLEEEPSWWMPRRDRGEGALVSRRKEFDVLRGCSHHQ